MNRQKLVNEDARTPEEMAEFGIKEWEPSKTKQEFKDDNDPQKIFDTYRKTGKLPVNMEPPKIVPAGTPPIDYSNTPTFQQAMETITKGTELFMQLPAELRKYFDNDTGKFLEFTNDPKNLDKGEELGLWKKIKPEPEKIQKVEVIQPPPKAEDKK